MRKCPKCGHQCQSGEAECPKCGTDFTYIEKKQAKAETEAAEKLLRKAKITARLFELINIMTEDQQTLILEYVEEMHVKKDRAHARIPCLLSTDYISQGRAHKNFIQDISTGGVFIETGESFSKGDEITLTLSLIGHYKPFKISGKIVRTDSQGIGVEFKTESQIQDELIKGLVAKVTEFKRGI